MKLPELKKRFDKRYVIRIIAGVLTIAMVGTGFSTYVVRAERSEEQETQTAESTEEEEESLTQMLADQITVTEKEVGKDETVYLLSDAAGTVKSTIVSDHLINSEKSDILKDRSTLADIQNVKGDETFAQSGDELTWQADGNDIYYQGTTSAKAPVSQKVTYYLNGKEVTPEELAGQSGTVTIRFDYTNTTTYQETVNGEDVSVVVPFAAITGMMLNDDFSNVEVTNGRIISSGTGNIVVGYALPGVTESLQITEDELEDVTIPEYFEMTAEVENFQLETAMTVVVNASDLLSAENSSDLSEVDTMLDTLTDASQQLQEGSAQLAEGLDTLAGKIPELTAGVEKLVNGIKDYTDGAAALDQGLITLDSGVDTLAGKIPTLTDGIRTLNGSAASIRDGVAALDTTLKTPVSEQEKASYYALAKQTVDAQFADDSNANGYAQIKEQAKSQFAATMTGDESISAAYQMLMGDAGTELQNAVKVSLQEQIAGAIPEAAITAVETCIPGADTRSAAVKYIYNNGLVSLGTGYENYTAAYFQGAVQQALGLPAAITSYDALESAVVSSKMETLAETMLTGIAAMASEQVGTSVADSVQKAAEEAAGQGVVMGIEAAKSSVASKIEEVGSNGYSLVTGVQALAAGTSVLADAMPELTTGIAALTGGVDQLVSGADTLVSNSSALTSGIGTLAQGTTSLQDGVTQLDEGANTLADGMVEFNEEGINKIVNAYKGEIRPLVNRLQAMMDAGAGYTTFTDVAENVNGSVKFIYKLDSIKPAE